MPPASALRLLFSGFSPACNLKTGAGNSGLPASYDIESTKRIPYFCSAKKRTLPSAFYAFIQLNYLQKYIFILSSPICLFL
jgi:hypothetical protein